MHARLLSHMQGTPPETFKVRSIYLHDVYSGFDYTIYANTEHRCTNWWLFDQPVESELIIVLVSSNTIKNSCILC